MENWFYQISFLSQDVFIQSNGAFMNFFKFIDCYSAFGKDVKIARWRIELSQYKFDIKYRPGKQNLAADTFSRIVVIGHPRQELHDLHEQLCHPGVT